MQHPDATLCPPIPRRLSSLTGDRLGSTAVEFSLILPILLAMFFGIIEVGHLLWTITALHMATQDAARCVSVSNASTAKLPCPDQTTMQTFAIGRTWGMTIPANTFTLSTPACGYQVTANYAYVPIVSYIPLSMNLSASACFPAWQ